MAAFLTASLVFALLVFSIVLVSAGQRNITAEPGDSVTLTCRAAENQKVIVVEWSRTDLGSDQHVLLYSPNQFDPEGQSPSFINRVGLLDVENGDVSLVLENVTTEDTGTYEGRVVQRGNDHRKRSHLGGDHICIVYLSVKPGNQDGPKEEGGSRTGLIAGVISAVVMAVLVLLVAVFVICRRKA